METAGEQIVNISNTNFKTGLIKQFSQPARGKFSTRAVYYSTVF
jgi:hypothetical protein